MNATPKLSVITTERRKPGSEMPLNKPPQRESDMAAFKELVDKASAALDDYTAAADSLAQKLKQG